MLKKLLPLLIATATLSVAQDVRFQWNYMNFTWPSKDAYERATMDGSYVPQNMTITGIKVWKDRVYLTLPRWKYGVPVVLASIPINGDSETSSPLLEPYPTWDMQRLHDCSALQYVQSMEIDPKGRMWLLENGRTIFLQDKPKIKCPSRLVILDLEKNGQVLLDYEFPRDVVHIETVFLNDIVLDHVDGGWAYITDTDSEFPGIVVFSLRDKTSWKVTHDSMKADETASVFRLNGTMFKVAGPIDGIALSPASMEGDRLVYYTPLASRNIFSVPARALRSRQPAEVEAGVRLVGSKSSQTDGMMMSAGGTLYYGLLGECAVGAWDSQRGPFQEHHRLVAQDPDVNQWPDTFAMDEAGRLWWTANRIQNFMTGKKVLAEINDRVLALATPHKSYQYYENGDAPQLPAIP